MGLPFGRGGLRNLHPSQTGNPAFFSHPRRHQLARLFDSLLSLQTAVRGQVHGFGRAGAAGCIYRWVTGVHGASLFFLPFDAYPNGSEFFGGLRNER
jgi:hypothetical protein